MIAPLLWTLGAGVATRAQRALRAARRERSFRQRFPVSASGIVQGAEPRTYEASGSLAMLLIHGYNDSPQSLDGIAQRVHEAGWTVRLPLLPGHGRSLSSFDHWTAEDTVDAVREEYATLRQRYSTVVVGGLSMGGALACWIAAEAAVDGVVLYAPMLFVQRTMEVAVSTARLWSLFSRYMSRGGSRSVHDPEAARAMIAYGGSTRRSLEALEKVANGAIMRLGFVHAPVLMMQSEEDNRLPRDQSLRAFSRIGSKDRTLEWTTGAGHVLTVDHGWEQVAARTVRWLQERTPARHSGTFRVATE
jgi:carboxylesterase